MKNGQKYAMIAALVIAVGIVFAMKQKDRNPESQTNGTATPPTVTGTQPTDPASPPPTASTPAPKALPQLIDLGAKKCIPCKMMAPILEELAQTHADQFTTTFCDVWENQEPAQRYGIRSIPTQIFLSPDGKELFRHEGFISKEDILKKWQELGVGTNEKSE